MARQITTKEMYTDVNGNLIAQYYDPSIDDFVPFAEQSAVRILDKDGNPISSDNGLPVQLTGRNVERIAVVNAFAITDTNWTTFEVETSKYKQVYFTAFHSHDTDVNVRIKPLSGRGIKFYDGEWQSGDNPTNQTTLAGNDIARYVINTQLNFLPNFSTKYHIDVRARDTAPTQGSITVEMCGVMN